MELTAHSLFHSNFPKNYKTFSVSVPSKPSLVSSSSLNFLSPTIFRGIQLQGTRISGRKNLSGLGPLHASEAEAPSADNAERWLLEPVGDGDTRHIGFKVETPAAFEIASNEVTVGRLPDKANIVIPVATVSGLHARLQKKEGKLLVTDLDSTNGTFIDNERLRPGVASAASSGSRIIFGDEHLAMFCVSKLEKDASPKLEESKDAPMADKPTEDAPTSDEPTENAVTN